MKKIAVFRFSALGDCILILPAIQALVSSNPDAEVYWIIERNLLPLFKDIPDIKFIPVEKPRSLRGLLEFRKQVADIEFDALIAAQASLRSNILYPSIKAKRKIGFDSSRGRELHGLFVNERIPFREEHLLDGFLGFVEYYRNEARGTIKPNWNIPLDPEAVNWAREKISGAFDPESHKQKKTIVINPAASKLERSCSSDFYADLITNLGESFNFILTGGSADWELKLAKDIEASVHGENFLNLVGETSLRQLAALISEADLMIAPDTGPIHLADALGKRVVGLYAVAPPELTGPYQNQDYVVNKYPLAVERYLGKRPEQVKWGQRVHHPEVMQLFEVAEVKAKIELALS